MIRNQANQTISFSMINKTNGDNVTTGTPTVRVRIGNAPWAAGGGSASYSGGGSSWDYTPTQAETNADTVAFEMELANAITQTHNENPMRDFDHDTEVVSANVTFWQGLPQVAVNGKPNVHASETAAGAITAASIAANALDDKGNWLQPVVAGRKLGITTSNEANSNVTSWRDSTPNTLDGTFVRCSVASTTTGGDSALQTAINGGTYPLNTSASGSVRIVSGTGVDEVKLTAGIATADVEAWQGQQLGGGSAMVQTDGSGNWQWTAKALELGGGGGSSPWTEEDVEGMRYRCQLNGKQTQPPVDAPEQFTVTADGLSAVATQVNDLHDWGGPQAIPAKVAAPTTLTAADASRWAYKLLIARRTQDATQEQVFSPVDDTLEHTRVKSDDGTATIGKLEVAP